MYDPNNKQDLETKRCHKGKRYCFIAAIVTADCCSKPAALGNEKNEFDEAHLMLDTLDIFEGGKSTADYHGMFNAKYFNDWMTKLLYALEVRKINNALIVMDNAKYH